MVDTGVMTVDVPGQRWLARQYHVFIGVLEDDAPLTAREMAGRMGESEKTYRDHVETYGGIVVLRGKLVSGSTGPTWHQLAYNRLDQYESPEIPVSRPHEVSPDG